jgi:hypothetical protein
MEPPYWYYSVRQSLGAMQLKAGNAADAEKTFRADLTKIKANGWPLFGLEQSLRAQNRLDEVPKIRREFEKAWKYADVQLNLDWF